MAELALGLAALGRPGYITLGHADELGGATDVAAMDRRCHEALDAAYAGGVRWFDAARSYGRAEAFLASWLARQLAESRSLLGAHLALYQIHSATLDSGVLDDRRVLERLAALRDGGLPVGLSLSGAAHARTLERALAVSVDGRPLFSAVQATWKLLERAVEASLRAARDAGWRVLVKE